MVRKVETVEEFKAFVNGDQLTVVDFYADWCGPCRAVAPAFTDMSIKYENAQFIKINTDDEELASIVNGAHINSIPTFILYKKGKKVAEMKGANAKALEELVVKNY